MPDLSIPGLTPIAFRLSDLKATKLNPGDPGYFDIDSITKAANSAETGPPAGTVADNDPSNLYASIQKGGQTIALIYKSGLVATPNQVQLPANLSNSGTGQTLANNRLSQLQTALGGTTQLYGNQTISAKAAAAAKLYQFQLAQQS